MLAGESTLAVETPCSDMTAIATGSLDRGEINLLLSCPDSFPSSFIPRPSERSSTEGSEAAGNLNPCARETESFRLGNGRPEMPGVFGAVEMPACLLPGRSATAASGNIEFKRGEGCVEERWPRGATQNVRLYMTRIR